MVVRIYGKEDEDGNWVRPVPKPEDEFTYQWNSDWADDPTKPILKITKSSMSTFKWCKLQYEFSYLDRRPVDRTDDMLKGTVVHSSWDDFHQDIDIKKIEDSTFLDIQEYFTSLFPIDDYTELTESMATFEAQRFVDSRHQGMIDTFLPVASEEIYNGRILIHRDTHKKYPLNRDYIVHLQGIVDKIFIENGSYIPMELKTGKWKDSKKTGIRREMAFYKLLMESDENCEFVPITHWGWYFPTSNYIYVEPVKTRTMNAMKQTLAEMIYAYELAEFPSSYFHKKCVWCSFQGICPAAIEAGLNNNEGDDWF
jgi:CRISPR/Cas system-associated exonuclease Cas4 (RecB family)